MGDNDHGEALLGKVPHRRQNLAHKFGIERRRRFVEQHQRWADRQRAGDRNPLLLAARELARVAASLLYKTDAVQKLARSPDRRLAINTMDADRCLDDVLQHRHVRIEVELLEHHADLAPLNGDCVWRQPVETAVAQVVADLFAVDLDRASVNRLKVVDAAQEGGLAGAGRTEDNHDLACRDVEVDPPEHFQLVERLMNVATPHERLGKSAHRLGSCAAGRTDCGAASSLTAGLAGTAVRRSLRL